MYPVTLKYFKLLMNSFSPLFVKAVQVLLASRANMNSEKSSGLDVKADSSTMETELQKVDPIQVSFFCSSISQALFMSGFLPIN